jgi:hypothetical protein
LSLAGHGRLSLDGDLSTASPIWPLRSRRPVSPWRSLPSRRDSPNTGSIPKDSGTWVGIHDSSAPGNPAPIVWVRRQRAAVKCRVAL